MNVVDLPHPSTHAIYEEAISRYAAMVRSRAVGVHRIGNPRYPGLSGIRLLVVTDRVSVDNRFFFSATHRLPERYHRLFLSEPFILPAWSLRVLRYTTHVAGGLVAGRNVLQPYAPSDEPGERWCRLLESYCEYAAFVASARTAQLLKARHTLEIAARFRHALANASGLIPEAANQRYCNEIESIRRTFFEGGEDRVERVRSAWEIFSAAFDQFDAVLRERLSSRSTEHAVAAARARLLAEETCDYFDRDYAFRRARDIDGYFQELASLGFPFGHLFFVAAHPGAPRALPAAPILDTVLYNVYRVRRRLSNA